jgi:uroporphyrinogen decarboxylase
VEGDILPLLIAGGEALERAVTELRAALGGGPYVFNLGHGVLPQTPPENVAALIETVHRETLAARASA